MFSERVPEDLRPNAITKAIEARGGVTYDLTATNPTCCGLTYPVDLLRSLGDPGALGYRPDPLGLRSAREAVAGEYARRGLDVDPERIVLTASSSEAYGFLFKLLCDPGDTVLVPSPSYPLFEHLARLDGVRTRPYALDPDAGWQPEPIDPGADRARAVIAVHPNNPTGSFLNERGRAELVRACAIGGAALIVDEVFFDYGLGATRSTSFATNDEVLTFTLGGLSKSAGLPQLKLSWIVVSGPGADEALERLAFIADNYLDVATPVQLALPEILRAALPVRSAILERCRENLTALVEAVAAAQGVSVIEPQGGWSACLRYPAVIAEEKLVLDLIEHDDVAVHPGYFFDFPTEGYLVVSLLPPPDLFRDGLRRLLVRLSSP
ncbi:MAG: pyridoxal phosphate-dependent aminotransferase [Acidobacteriota bacterium]|nr:pyridoxal phosphate-dependent aminotransferase [Acidobacteriota bacterium]